MVNIKMPPQLECKKCSHKWFPRKEAIFVCPKCKNPRWNEGSKKFEVIKVANDELLSVSFEKLFNSKIFNEELSLIGSM